MIPHAWIEFEGKITDISLTKTEFPEAQLSGALIVLDEVIRPGEIMYTYHKVRTPEALNALEGSRQEEVVESQTLHASMVAISRRPKQIRKYLKSAPSELSFRVLAKAAAFE